MACTIAALEGELPSSEMNELVTEILASSLRSIGLFSNGIHRIAGLSPDKQPAQYYERWLESSIRHLQEQDVLAADLTFLREVRPLADLWDEWEGKVSAWACDSHRQEQAALLKACLEGLPAVLSGNQPASDGMFPEHLIEGPQVDYFNDVLGRTLSAHIERQLQIDPQRKFRIIEIGAGTGGTTAALLPIVERYPIEEYCYTDRSRASLMHAERQFRPLCPVLTTSIFDVSLPLESQSVAMNHYDFAIAANVLHATANIREAVRNAKAVLRNEGVLLLNEFSTWSLFNHLTVGRLVEWWQYEDAAVRRPGSPGLSPETWREILTAEGFESIAFPAEEAHELGQQIIAAVSNGWTRQRIVKIAPPPRVEPAYVKPPDVAETRATRTASPSPAHLEQLATDHTRRIITTMLGEALRMDAGAIQDDAPFAGYGVDSIVGVNLVRKISEALQIDLESTSLFEYSTVDELARYISTKWHDRITAQVAQLHSARVSSRITPDRKPAEAEPDSEQVSIGVTRFTDIRIASDPVEVIESADAGTDPIAIIGMSGRFAESETLEAFWEHLAEGHHLVKQVSRWSPRECVMPGSAAEGYCSDGSFIDSIDQFDPAFFGLSELEATYMDPQQRLFLEESWKALEDAGYACASVSEKQCGVYVGCGSSKYDRLHPRETPPSHAFWGNSSAVTPARIAYRLNLQGPALAVDTACSSSLVAIHLACQGLWSREMEMALAGGVFLNATPGFYHVANRANMLSPDGKCHSFDASANGFVPGEGVGVLVLKRLSDAMADGDSIHGVIVGSGINQDGRSNGLTAPNGRAQERLERSVYDRYKIDPATIQVVEAHATGTLLGDSVEHAALTRAFREHTDKTQFCALGTVKTNIGHTSAAAGVAGVLKLLLSLKHRQIPPSLHFEKGNPAIDFDSGPFYVNTELKNWNAGADDVRRAAVSSFGFGGTNAHLVIDEAPAIARRDDVAPAYLVVLSARSGEQLKQQVSNLLAHVDRTPDLSLTDLSFTLLMGRMHFGHRLACVAQNQAELARLLGQWSESGAAPHVYAALAQEGNVRERVSLKKFGNHCIETLRSSPDADGYGENLTAIAELYVQGYALEFRSLFPEDARRIPLPTYPFARARYWIEDERELATLPSRETGTAREARSGGDPAGAFPFGSDGGDVQGTLQNDLSGMVIEILGLSHGNVSSNEVLQDLGLDSVGLSTFAKAINDHYQLDLTPVLFFDYPSIGEIAKYLSEKYGSDLRRVPAAASSASGPASQVLAPSPAAGRVTHAHATSRTSRPEDSFDRHAVHEPVAIVGMAGVMPQSDDLDELWVNLANSRNVITVIPRDRWNWEDSTGDPRKEMNKSNSKWGGFMRAVDKFDPRFFGISPREAEMIDPQQRIFLETAWKAIEDAGQKASELSGTRTGVFAAAGNNDYKEVLRNVQGGLDGYSAAGNTNSVLANRISFLLNLRGPSENLDTACSSVLVALNRAVDSIHSGECDMAVVGGVNALVSPEPYIAFGKAGLLSTDGKCKTFDKRANGFVRAEGAGAVFVKKLSAAEADGNHIYAVVRSTAVNHGGRVPTLGAPSASGQTALLIEAYEKAGIDPTTVGYIECHGTGTALGDPIETDALSTAFAELYKRHGKAPAEIPHCGLGSIKTNVGHLENAAGIAGVVKVLLALKHKQIPANLHFEELNPYIRLERTPFYIVDKLTPWVAPTAPDGSPLPRRAGVSSFGFGGTNSHVVLEEYVPRTREHSDPAHGPELIVLSAKNEDRLQAYARSMLTYLETTAVELRDLAHTLQVGRDEMPERLAMVAASPEDVRQKLEQFLEGRGKSTDFFHGNTRASTARGVEEETPVQALAERKELAKLGELWVSGTKIDWKLLREGSSARRISLPTYPFARERHWATVDLSAANAQRDRGPAAAAVLHPMVHRNVSTLEEQKFASRFSGDEFYFDDHRVETQKVLPAVGYLEIVRAAGELAGIPKVRVIRNVTWQRPLTVGGDGEGVEILLTPDNKDVKFSVRTVGRGRPIEHCTGKLASSGGTAVPEVLDIAAIRERCPRQVLSGPELYGAFLAGSGLDLRRSFQIVQKMYANESESLAILQLPEHLRADADQFFLHPAMMDGAVHSFLGLLKRSGSEPLTLSLPFSMGEVQILHPLKDLYYGYATLAGDVRDRDNQKLTIYLLDQRGTVLVRLKDFVLRPVPRGVPTAKRENVERTIAATRQEEITASLQTLIPVWNTVRLDATKRLVAPASTEIVLAGSDDAQLDWVRKSFPNARLLSSSESLADCAFDQLIWIAPDVTDASQRDWDDRLIERQEEGVLSVFRLIKTLLQSGYAAKGLKWTLITQRTQRVNVDDAIQPAHAGIAGLIGSVAKEYPRWDLRMLDVDSLASVSAQECLSLPWDKQGNALAHRSGEWFQQGLARLETTLPEAKSLYRKNGVYVVIGGAGGVGEVWSRFMIERYQARIVWIGRRASDAGIEARISALAGLGNAPLYIPADAADFNALERAREIVLQTYGAIHGVVHSAIVLQDQSIARMDESTFSTTLSAKVDVSVNMERVFGGQNLDFMLFFSSMISFIKSAGQSNYSAGCTFKDAFAHTLQQKRSYPVKIMNWGYWGSVGIVADEEYNKRMARMGAASIEPEEGMASLEAFVNADVPQIALFKTLTSDATAFGLSETITCPARTAPTILTEVKVTAQPIAPLEADGAAPEMMQLMTEILASSLQSIGLFRNGIETLAGLAANSAPYLERWLSSSIHYLKEQQLVGDGLIFNREIRDLADLWTAWDAKKESWTTSENRGAHIALLEACLRALPGVLTGKQLPTDVMFPKSSMRLVEPVYRGNLQADYFNGALRDTLLACIEQLLKADGNRKIRILEIGAGTGGTTAGLLPALQQYPVEEYCYTDLSKAFLMHAERNYRPQLPALTTAIFDVSKPLASQSIRAGHYDVAIAANVLHATPNIRETLRNAKAVLNNQGVLLLNELSNWSLLTHVTFGLLEGWWLYEDVALRLPGTPGIGTDKWREVLAEEGFEPILFTTPDAARFGQQIIAAGSNGWVRQRLVKGAAPRPAAPVKQVEPVPVAPQPTQQVSSDHIRRIVIDALSEALKLDPDTIRNDEPFADYGVDSIVGVNLVTTIGEKLQIELETTKLFEYTTVDQIAEYIATQYREQLPAQPAPQPASQPPSQVQINSQPPVVSARSAEGRNRMSADYVRGIISETVSEALKLDPATIRNDEPFADYGVDSIIGVNLVTTISEKLQIELDTTRLFEFTTIDQLADHIQSEWRDHIAEQLPVAASAPAPVEIEFRPEHRFATREPLLETVRESNGDESKSRDVSTDRIAIIGISGRFAESESLEEFWRNLKEGKDLIRTVSRWSTSDCAVPGSTGQYCTDGSFIDSIDQFDPAFFRISPEEAACMDPQQRLFLEESWKALEDAGYAGRSVREKQCGVYVGCVASRYRDMLGADRPPYALWGTTESIIPTRIAYHLDLQGPAIAIDTACSSSLVAIHLACQALWTRETEMALAGGIFLQPTSGFYRMANRAGMLSPDGRCFSFDERANGYVPGEGVGVLVLKRLRDALADGDYIYGVIAGTGINQDGASNGLIAPNPRAQERLERSVYDRFEINPETIQLVEAHGTGTLLGDSIEYGALSRAFRAYTDKKQFCALGTMKTNFGHTVTAAGVAGVLKVLLSMKHRQIPPSLHLRKANPGIAFESGPFYVNSELKEWTVEDNQPRRAAVSSFGFNGTNAHLVIEEAPAPARTVVEAPGYLLALSARTREQLQQHTANLLVRLKATPGMSMNDSSFSLFVGRMHFPHRLACVVRSQEEAIQLLEQWVQTGATTGQVYASEVQEGRTREHVSLTKMGNRCIQDCRNATNVEYLENLAAIADLYVQGYSLEFQALFPGNSRRVPLPTYPFARERYWVDAVKAAEPQQPAAPSARLHPLLHTNTSTLDQQSYGCTLTGTELFLRDQYPVANGGGGLKVLSEAAYLEMARAAMEISACIPEGSSVVDLQDIVWADPMVVEGNKQMTIALFASDDEHVSYEIYSGEGEREIIHCQGRAFLGDQPAPSPLGRGQLIARVSLPSMNADGRDGGYGLHPTLIGGALQAAGDFIAARGDGAGAALVPRAMDRLRILAPCTEEVFVWRRRASENVMDIDLIDAGGNVCVQMRGLSFHADVPAAEPADRRTWLFAKERASTAGGIGAVEKITLFLTQDTALQLQKAMEEVPTDQSFFDLGLTSLGMAHLVQNTGRLLDEDLSPSMLFDYSDIRSLAAHLAMTYPAKIDAVKAVRQVESDPGVILPGHAAPPAALLRRRRVSGALTRTPREADVSIEQILESVSWQEASLHDGYEKVTF